MFDIGSAGRREEEPPSLHRELGAVGLAYEVVREELGLRLQASDDLIDRRVLTGSRDRATEEQLDLAIGACPPCRGPRADHLFARGQQAGLGLRIARGERARRAGSELSLGDARLALRRARGRVAEVVRHVARDDRDASIESRSLRIRGRLVDPDDGDREERGDQSLHASLPVREGRPCGSFRSASQARHRIQFWLTTTIKFV